MLPKQLQPLAGPAAAGLQQLAGQLAPRVLASPVVQGAWVQANIAAHKELLRVLNGGVVLIGPTPAFRNIVWILVFAGLLAYGVTMLRRQTAVEFAGIQHGPRCVTSATGEPEPTPTRQHPHPPRPPTRRSPDPPRATPRPPPPAGASTRSSD